MASTVSSVDQSTWMAYKVTSFSRKWCVLSWLILDDDEHGLRMVSESLVHIRFLSGSRRWCLSSGFSIRKKGKIKVPGECFFSMHSSAWVSMLVKTIIGLCLVWIYTQTEIEMSLWLSSSFVVNLNIAELCHKDMNLI